MILETIALIGTILVAFAYLPQIFHLLSTHCTYGISVKAWAIWLVATLLILPHTISLGDSVLIFLNSTNAGAVSFITVFAYFHRGQVCGTHQNVNHKKL